MMVEND